MKRVVAPLGLTILSLVLVVSAGTSQDAGKTPAKDSTKTTGKTAAKDAVKDAGKEAAKDDAKDATKLKGTLPNGWKSLKLTPEQVQKVYAVQNDFKGKINEQKDRITEAKGKIADLETQETAEEYKVLNDDQKAALQKMTTGEAPKSTTTTKKGKAPAPAPAGK